MLPVFRCHFIFAACVRTLPERDFRGKIEPPVEKGVLKVERHSQRLTQRYSAYEGSYLWAPVDVKNELHVDEMTIATNSNQKKGLNMARTC